MIGLWLAITGISAVVLAMLLVPLMRRGGGPAPPRGAFDLTVYKDQLAEVDRDLDRGLLSQAEADAARTEIERRMLAADPGEEAGAEPPPRPARAIRWSTALIVIVVPAGAIALYAYLGQPGTPDFPFAQRDLAREAAEAGRGKTLREAVTQLARRLIENPDDVRGWLLLGRSYMVMRRYDDAATALRMGMKAGQDTPEIQADYAEALIYAAEGSVTPEARQHLEAALAGDALSFKARFYLGMAKAQEGKVREAMQDWIDLVAVSPPDAPWLPAVRQRIARAAQRLGIDEASVAPSPEALKLAREAPAARAVPAAPEAARPSPADAEAIARMPAEERARLIRSMVQRLADRLRESPDDLAGWQRLEKAYRVLGETEKAAEARARIEALTKKSK